MSEAVDRKVLPNLERPKVTVTLLSSTATLYLLVKPTSARRQGVHTGSLSVAELLGLGHVSEG